MKRLFILLSLTLMLFLSVVLISGCGEGKKKYRIGVSQCSNDYWRVKTNEDLQRELLLQDDAELEIRMADSDNDRQISDIRYFIDNGFDLIIVSPNESAAITPAIEEAKRKGIPVVTFDRMVEGEAYTAHIEVDNRALGEAAAKYAPSVIKEPIRAIEIQGPASASPAQLRHKGFSEGMAGIPSASVVESVYADWDAEKAYRLTDSLLKIHPETNLIFSHTDHMAIRASQAAADNGRADIVTVGIDGFPHIGLQAVKDSVLKATFLYSTEGDRIIKTSLDILNGRPYDRITRVAPLSPIDLSNVDIILSQDTLLTRETEKINLLHGKLDEYWQQHSIQTWLLYAVILILVLAGGVVALLLRSVYANKRHHEVLMQKNTLLEEEKEKQKSLYEQLQEATRSKLTFFTNVSHDLRTPLALISGSVEELSKAVGLKPNEQKLAMLARKNISILRRLITQILDFRKYESGKVELHLSEVDFPVLLREWTEAFRDVARRRSIRLSIEMKGEGPDSVAIDVEKMERVFFNLMSNAFKHTPDNGRIKVIYTGGGDMIRFSVKDTGSGIAADDCKKIFELFYQAGEVSHKGSGIGLALTKAFVELHGGSITVESEPGAGSEFTVTLPVRHCERRIEQPAALVGAQAIATELGMVDGEDVTFESEKPIVLVIDDNSDIRELLGTLLGEKYNVLYAPDGRKGLRMAVKYVTDLIICDVMMPEMDGMECVRRIKEEVSTSHIPVLMLTACSMEEQQVAGFESGADGYVSKPFSNDVLLAHCRSLLQNRRRLKDGTEKGLTVKMQEKREEKVPSQHHSAGDIDSEFYKRFLSLVDDRMSDSSLSVEEVASTMGLSQSQFTRKIKALTNFTPVEIIRNRRLRKAKRDLETTERTVSEVAFRVGFTSLAYFSKCYKDAYGITPTEAKGAK
ncbi:MAG: substrate-binding domain-containing protein [Muribaculaceae bacterium]|nr:substrate-binding domain-containing protein [Muribaculaceae bacterium]